MKFFKSVMIQIFFASVIFIGFTKDVNSFPRDLYVNTFCFTLDELAKYCPQAQYATITLQVLKMDPNGFLIPVQTYTGSAVPTTTKYVDGKETRVFESNQYRKESYRDLYKHHHGRYPNDSELAAITDQEAQDWFRDKFKRRRTVLFNSWWSYPENVRTFTETKSEICFDISTQGFHSMDGWVTFPSGAKCKIDFTDWVALKSSGKSGKVPIKFPFDGCSACL